MEGKALESLESEPLAGPNPCTYPIALGRGAAGQLVQERHMVCLNDQAMSPVV